MEHNQGGTMKRLSGSSVWFVLCLASAASAAQMKIIKHDDKGVLVQQLPQVELGDTVRFVLPVSFRLVLTDSKSEQQSKKETDNEWFSDVVAHENVDSGDF